MGSVIFVFDFYFWFLWQWCVVSFALSDNRELSCQVRQGFRDALRRRGALPVGEVYFSMQKRQMWLLGVAPQARPSFLSSHIISCVLCLRCCLMFLAPDNYVLQTV